MTANWGVELSCTVFIWAKSHSWTKQDYFLKVIFLSIFTKLICHQNFEIGNRDLSVECHVLISLIQLVTFHKSPILLIVRHKCPDMRKWRFPQKMVGSIIHFGICTYKYIYLLKTTWFIKKSLPNQVHSPLVKLDFTFCVKTWEIKIIPSITF